MSPVSVARHDYSTTDVKINGIRENLKAIYRQSRRRWWNPTLMQLNLVKIVTACEGRLGETQAIVDLATTSFLLWGTSDLGLIDQVLLTAQTCSAYVEERRLYNGVKSPMSRDSRYFSM